MLLLIWRSCLRIKASSSCGLKEVVPQEDISFKKSMSTTPQQISDNILKKCGGSPLAIIAISGLLANKAQTEDEWEQVQNSIGYSVERMMRILSLSYFDLQHDLKTCLLYLSMFPEDYVIEKN